MSNVIERLEEIRNILKLNGQKEALEQIEDVIKNINDKEKVRNLDIALSIKDFGDLDLPMYDGNWWNIINETKREVQQLYFVLESNDPDLEKYYLDMLKEMIILVKQSKDEKLIVRLEQIIYNYNSPVMIKDLIQICNLQKNRPIKYVSKKYGSWKELVEELYYKANSYLEKIEKENKLI